MSVLFNLTNNFYRTPPATTFEGISFVTTAPPLIIEPLLGH